MSTSLTDLITLIRQRTNQEKSQWVTDAELTTYLNYSLGELDDMLVDLHEDYKLTEAQFTIADPSVPQFNLPSDFLKARGLARQINGSWMTLDRYQYPKRNTYAFPSINYLYGYSDVFYKLEDGYCKVIPAQTSAGVYLLGYVPKFTYLSGTDVLPAYMDTNAWCEYGVVDVCIKVLAKDNLDPSVFMQQKQGLQARIINAAKNRDSGPPKTIQNTRLTSGWHGSGWGNNW